MGQNLNVSAQYNFGADPTTEDSIYTHVGLFAGRQLTKPNLLTMTTDYRQ